MIQKMQASPNSLLCRMIMSHWIIVFQPIDSDLWKCRGLQVHADESWKWPILQTSRIHKENKKNMHPWHTMDIDVILDDIMIIQKNWGMAYAWLAMAASVPWYSQPESLNTSVGFPWEPELLAIDMGEWVVFVFLKPRWSVGKTPSLKVTASLPLNIDGHFSVWASILRKGIVLLS